MTPHSRRVITWGPQVTASCCLWLRTTRGLLAPWAPGTGIEGPGEAVVTWPHTRHTVPICSSHRGPVCALIPVASQNPSLVKPTGLTPCPAPPGRRASVHPGAWQPPARKPRHGSAHACTHTGWRDDAALAEDPNSVIGTHIWWYPHPVAHNYL